MEQSGHMLSIIILILYVLNDICAQNEDTYNDVGFDFDTYYRVILNTTQSTPRPMLLSDKMATLYNPHIWPGPNDTHLLSTQIVSNDLTTRTPNLFRFGDRRTFNNESRNRGYGYDTGHTVSTKTKQTVNNSGRPIYGTKIVPSFRNFNNSFRPTFRYNGTIESNTNKGGYDYASRKFDDSVNIPTYARPMGGSFSCERMPYYGYYADIENNCQSFHVCTPDGRKTSFLCPDKTLFNQRQTICDWFYNVNCQQSTNFYQTNAIKFSNWNTARHS